MLRHCLEKAVFAPNLAVTLGYAVKCLHSCFFHSPVTAGAIRHVYNTALKALSQRGNTLQASRQVSENSQFLASVCLYFSIFRTPANHHFINHNRFNEMVFLKRKLAGRTFVVQTLSTLDSSSSLFMVQYWDQQMFTPGERLTLHNARRMKWEDRLNPCSRKNFKL